MHGGTKSTILVGMQTDPIRIDLNAESSPTGSSPDLLVVKPEDIKPLVVDVTPRRWRRRRKRSLQFRQNSGGFAPLTAGRSVIRLFTTFLSSLLLFPFALLWFLLSFIYSILSFPFRLARGGGRQNRNVQPANRAASAEAAAAPPSPSFNFSAFFERVARFFLSLTRFVVSILTAFILLPINLLRRVLPDGSLKGQLTALAQEYDNPQSLQQRLTFSYALVTCSVFLLVWLITVAFQAADLFEFFAIALISALPIAIAVGLAVFGLGSFFGYIASRELADRIETLDEAATAWSLGRFEFQVEDRANDEIGRLGRKLNSMAERLDQLINDRADLAAVEERTYIARELHDAVKQQLFASSMQLAAARSVVEANPDQADKIMEDLELLVEDMQGELASLIHMLRPTSIQEEGLEPALLDYVTTWSRRMMVEVECDVEPVENLSNQLQQALYRIVQEALANVAKHAEATFVSVRLYQIEKQTFLHIEDDGKGFDRATLDASAKPDSGFGLQSMQGRLARFNGRVTIKSNVGLGTTVTAIVNSDQMPVSRAPVVGDQ